MPSINADCRISRKQLSGITPQPKGTAELVCTFEVDANGLLKVSALDKTSGRKANITITNSVGRLSSTEIDQMIKDAGAFLTFFSALLPVFVY